MIYGEARLCIATSPAISASIHLFNLLICTRVCILHTCTSVRCVQYCALIKYHAAHNVPFLSMARRSSLFRPDFALHTRRNALRVDCIALIRPWYIFAYDPSPLSGWNAGDAIANKTNINMYNNISVSSRYRYGCV